ncbi:hypothetical protein [Allorhodopirellula heiligendammensis]|uniref:Uncharacterized protein n=1 Tax=Allorhodopirellula heiligendammensis TaxID=2714739 RepID=A0A5C6C5N6_9BACT|nr:hypothetical protein [Allorhodopirellula heiligendammensis]TWU19435.1 hypothetical protein Poly21_16080 [Allorhodopirellula heiligendammensis]
MTFWTESEWRVFASTAKENLQFEQELPFALIGSGTHCHPRLPVQAELETAYFACSFDDRIELWPLCAVAFPAWGIIPCDVEVLLGHYRLRFEKHPKPSLERAGSNSPQDTSLIPGPGQIPGDMRLTMAWEQKSVTKPIARAVTILGSQHPSVWRTRGRQMLPCDHALVCANHRLWLVDLHPPENSMKNSAVFELLANQEYYQVGDMRLSLGPASVECEASVTRRKRLQSRADASETSKSHGSSASTSVKTLPAAERVTRERAIPERVATEGGGSAEDYERTDAKSMVLSNTAATSPTPVLEGFDCPEMLTSRLTGRLVSINQSRFTRAKSLRVGASAITFAAAIAFLVWLFQ